jgi:hypothetical protein
MNIEIIVPQLFFEIKVKIKIIARAMIPKSNAVKIFIKNRDRSKTPKINPKQIA